MKTFPLLPLTAAMLFAACTGSMLMSAQTADPTAQARTTAAGMAVKIVDLPAVVVHGDPVLAAELRAEKERALQARIVDLPAVVVHGDPVLAAELHAAKLAAAADIEIVDLPTVTVRPTVEDALPVIAAGLAPLAR